MQYLLSVMLHFTPLGYILCAALLSARRRDGGRSRLILAITFFFWGLIMLSNLAYHYVASEGTQFGVFSMTSLNLALFTFLLMLLYPMEMVREGGVTLDSGLVLFMPWIVLNLVLLLIQPEFSYIGSFSQITLHLSAYNVWLRLLVVVCLLVLFIVVLYISYKRMQKDVNARWVRKICTVIVINTIFFLIWIFSGSDVALLLMRLSCLLYCLIVTYQELYLRNPLPPQSKSAPFAVTSNVRMACPVARSPLWSKLVIMMETEKVWSNPDLTLVELASMLGTNRTTLSNLIQENGYDGFYALINTYRIREFLDIVERQEISGIHETFFDVGFRSKSTAIRYFRQQTGTSPSEYLQRRMESKR